MRRFIELGDGSIQFPMNGPPPMIVPGYEVDPGDPYRFHLELEPCAARTFKNVKVGNCCPEGRNVRHCTKFNLVAMTPPHCKNCVEKGEHVPIKSELEALPDTGQSTSST